METLTQTAWLTMTPCHVILTHCRALSKQVKSHITTVGAYSSCKELTVLIRIIRVDN